MAVGHRGECPLHHFVDEEFGPNHFRDSNGELSFQAEVNSAPSDLVSFVQEAGLFPVDNGFASSRSRFEVGIDTTGKIIHPFDGCLNTSGKGYKWQEAKKDAPESNDNAKVSWRGLESGRNSV
jgi:hypothetical protein